MTPLSCSRCLLCFDLRACAQSMQTGTASPPASEGGGRQLRCVIGPGCPGISILYTSNKAINPVPPTAAQVRSQLAERSFLHRKVGQKAPLRALNHLSDTALNCVHQVGQQ